MEIKRSFSLSEPELNLLIIEHPIKDDQIPDLRAALMQRQGLTIRSAEQAKTAQNLLDDERLKNDFVITRYLKRALEYWNRAQSQE